MTDWYELGKNKHGEPLPPVTKPKLRLTPTQIKVLSLFIDNKIIDLQSAKSMLAMLELYKKSWPKDNFTEAKMSRDLANLAKNWFLSSDKGAAITLSDLEQSFMRTKTLYCQSQKVQNGELTADADRFVMLNGKYIASEKTRAKAKERELRKAKKNDTLA